MIPTQMTHRESVQSNVIVTHGKVKLECEAEEYTSILTHLHINLLCYKAGFTRGEYNIILFFLFPFVRTTHARNFSQRSIRFHSKFCICVEFIIFFTIKVSNKFRSSKLISYSWKWLLTFTTTSRLPRFRLSCDNFQFAHFADC